MADPYSFIYSPAFSQYDFGPSHPFNPVRLLSTVSLLNTLDLLPPCQVALPEPADIADLKRVHSAAYIALVQSFQSADSLTHPKSLQDAAPYGLGTEDDPVFLHMHEAASLAVGGTLGAAKLIAGGSSLHALNLAGGLHHAKASAASGFCIYNDVAVAIKWLRAATPWRIAYIDTDAHHGDGVQSAFYDDPNVLTISFHETGQYLFPGTGSVEETGSGEGAGYALNIPLRPYTDDASWLECLSDLVPEALSRFKPDILVTQHGCDGHYWDPLTDLVATTYFYWRVPALMHEWAHRYAQGRWLAVGGGGYEIWRVVPRAWAMLWAEMSHHPIAEQQGVPARWMAQWQPSSENPLPTQFIDAPDTAPQVSARASIAEQNLQTVQRLKKLLGWL